MVVFSRFYAPYLVWENGEETAGHFLHHEEAIRIYLAGAFVHGVGMIVLLDSTLLRAAAAGEPRNGAVRGLGRSEVRVFWFIFILDVLGALRFFGGAGALQGFRQDGLVALAGRSWMRAGCLLSRPGVQRAGIGAVRLGAVSIAIHSGFSRCGAL